ncbi:MAG: F0F1 ATP synthase subunit beta, partial [Patescibacteria group bacterium]
MTKGIIAQIIGPVVDVRFEGELPAILSALTIERKDQAPLTLEVAQHVGNSMVRTVAMSSTDGLMRGLEVTATGKPISVPVGEATLGRMFNVTGEPIDGKGPVKAKEMYPIHRPAPDFTE